MYDIEKLVSIVVEYLEAVEIQQEKDFAAWYTFTESSIKTIFQ